MTANANVNIVAKTLDETRLSPLTDEVNDTELACSTFQSKTLDPGVPVDAS